MKTQLNFPSHRRLAFTLIELLVVIAIIGVLAGLLFPAGAAIKRKATVNKARTQLKMVALAIDNYKAKFGYYPPDHAPATDINLMQNSLYFELSGVTNDTANGFFQTLDGAARIPAGNVQATFGQGAILNCTKGGGDDNGQPAVSFLKELKPRQYVDQTNTVPNTRFLTCSVEWPLDRGPLLPGIANANPWRYMVTGATNNPGHYDLWVDIILSGKTNRISNWRETPEIVP